MPNSGAARWLIADRTNGNMDVFTIDDGGERVLPIFSFLDEAEMYVRLQIATPPGNPPGAPRWEPRACSPGEIVSVLFGRLSDVARVALEPLPEVCGKTILDLLSVGREAFVLSLVGEGTSAVSAGTSQHPPDGPSHRPSSATPFIAASRAATNPPSLWREDVL